MSKQLMRADARRSYDRILEAAGTVIAQDGENASLEEIARTAGVGSATLHRHFASRWDLLDAVFADRVDKICAEAERFTDHEPAKAALTDWLRLLTVESARNRGLAASMFRGRPDEHVPDDSCHAKIQSAGQMLLTNAVAAGEVRPDAALADILRLVSAIVLSTDESENAAADSATMIDLVLEGIHSRPR
jgi:AcrR family transcriptional regulator